MLRAQWQARVLREAGFDEVWQYVTLADQLENWPRIYRHLGRRRPFCDALLDDWRRDGALPG